MGTFMPWGEWKPDTTDYESTSQVHTINNVLPRGDGYGPFPSFAAATLSLPDVCRGGCYAIKTDGTVQVFAGTQYGLFQLNNTNTSWIPVSRLANCTITNASPGVVSLTNTFAANEPVVFEPGTGTLPAQLVAGTVYYVSATGLSGSVFSVSATPGGATINTTGGSGTVSVTGHYGQLGSTAQWQFRQFNTQLIATQANDVVQTFDLTGLSGTGQFTNLGGTPPQAAYVSVVGRFLVLSGLLSNPFRVQWSGLNALTTWTSGVNSSDFQDFSDGGVVRGVAGGEFGVVFQDQAIRRMDYIPGSAVIFQIERIANDMGLFAPYSLVSAGPSIYFRAGQGFYKIDAGGLPTQIGRERIDRYFTGDLDANNLQLFIGASDPRSSRVYWAYKSGAGAAGTYDKILGYDIQLDRFFTINMNGQYLLGVSQAGVTLEGLNNISSSIEALPLSLDSYATALQPQIAQFNASNQQGFFTGSNLEATIESAEQGTAGQLIYTDGFRPVTDATTVYGNVSWRETQAQTPTYGTEIAMNGRTGFCNLRREARYIRFKVRIPAGTTWNFAAGFEPTPQLEGTT